MKTISNVPLFYARRAFLCDHILNAIIRFVSVAPKSSSMALKGFFNRMSFALEKIEVGKLFALSGIFFLHVMR